MSTMLQPLRAPGHADLRLYAARCRRYMDTLDRDAAWSWLSAQLANEARVARSNGADGQQTVEYVALMAAWITGPVEKLGMVMPSPARCAAALVEFLDKEGQMIRCRNRVSKNSLRFCWAHQRLTTGPRPPVSPDWSAPQNMD